MTLDTSLRVIGLFEVAKGTLDSCIVHPREIFSRALLSNAASITIAHNHPSGSLNFSKEDKELTKKIEEVDNIIGIRLVDHIILADGGYASYREML